MDTGKTGYIVFAGSTYYPGGGVDDYVRCPQTIQDARDWLATQDFDWWQIVDHHTMILVQSYETPIYGGKGVTYHATNKQNQQE